MLLHVLVPCIILSTVVPLVLPCTAFYLLLKRWSDQWTIVSVRMPRPPPSSEPVGFVALRMLSGCLLVYQLAMTGFFLLKGLCRSTLHSAAPTAPLLSPLSLLSLSRSQSPPPLRPAPDTAHTAYTALAGRGSRAPA